MSLVILFHLLCAQYTFNLQGRYTVLMLTLLTFRYATNADKSTSSGYENLRPKINLNYVERFLDIGFLERSLGIG